MIFDKFSYLSTDQSRVLKVFLDHWIEVVDLSIRQVPNDWIQKLVRETGNVCHDGEVDADSVCQTDV